MTTKIGFTAFALRHVPGHDSKFAGTKLAGLQVEQLLE